jgi:hypothetical protein
VAEAWVREFVPGLAADRDGDDQAAVARVDGRRMPRLSIPNRPTTKPRPMGQHQRVTALQRVLADDTPR